MPPPDRMPDRPAPLVLVTTPAEGQPFGSHAAIDDYAAAWPIRRFGSQGNWGVERTLAAILPA